MRPMLRHPSRWVVLLGLGLGWNPGASLAQGRITFDLGLWEVQPSGHLALGSAGRAGTEADVDKDLHLDDTERVLQGAAFIGGEHQLALAYFAYDASARGPLPRPLTVGAHDFPATTALHTELDVGMLGLGYRYAGGTEEWQSGFALSLYNVQVEQVSRSATLQARGELSTLCPVITIHGSWQPAMMLGLQGSVSGGAWDARSTSLTYLDAQASARLLLYPFVAGLGYRHLALQGDDSDLPFEVDLTFSGPVFFAGIAF